MAPQLTVIAAAVPLLRLNKAFHGTACMEEEESAGSDTRKRKTRFSWSSANASSSSLTMLVMEKAMRQERAPPKIDPLALKPLPDRIPKSDGRMAGWDGLPF